MYNSVCASLIAFVKYWKFWFMGRDIIHRYAGNPIIGIEDIPFRCSDIWNAGMAHYGRKYLLLLTVENLEGLASVYIARSTDGRHFDVDELPFLDCCTCRVCDCYKSYGIHDARISKLTDSHYITYVASSECGSRLGLVKTLDFSSVEELPYPSEPDNKSAALFPEKINGCYAMLERPAEGGSIWISYSTDLVYWGRSEVVMTPRSRYWDCHRIGTACPPMAIDAGWLLIYYGEKHTSAGPLVRLGAAILDRQDPGRVLARSNIPILAPRERYERIGDVGNIVFSCGAMLDKQGVLSLYYGGSDSCICLGTCQLEDILANCQTCLEDE